jgi:hypothetical protein
MTQKRLKKIAKEIKQAEREINLGKSVLENQAKIETIMSSLSINDLLALMIRLEQS